MGEPVVLIIDDERFWRDLLTRFLTASDYTVCSADGCSDGVAMASARRPDCILLDYNLRDGNAVDVCERVKALSEIKDTPIIVFSSDADAELSAYRDCHADLFILKGQPFAKVLDGVGSVIALGAERARLAKDGPPPPGTAQA